jgi:hypothetical protein
VCGTSAEGSVASAFQDDQLHVSAAFGLSEDLPQQFHHLCRAKDISIV